MRSVFNQSCPVHPVSQSRKGGLSVTEDGGQKTEILVSNIGLLRLKNQIKVLVDGV